MEACCATAAVGVTIAAAPASIPLLRKFRRSIFPREGFFFCAMPNSFFLVMMYECMDHIQLLIMPVAAVRLIEFNIGLTLF